MFLKSRRHCITLTWLSYHVTVHDVAPNKKSSLSPLNKKIPPLSPQTKSPRIATAALFFESEGGISAVQTALSSSLEVVDLGSSSAVASSKSSPSSAFNVVAVLHETRLTG